MQLFLFRSDHCSFGLDVFSSLILSPYRQPPIFRCKWSHSQIIDPANSWMYPDKVLTQVYPAKFLSRFADVIALSSGRWYFVTLPRISVMHCCWSFFFTCSYREASSGVLSRWRYGRARASGEPSLSLVLSVERCWMNPSCRMLPPGCRTFRSYVVCSWFRRCLRLFLALHYMLSPKCLDLIMLSSLSLHLWTSRLRDKRLIMIKKLSPKDFFL
jgi:hypothetical protein